MADDIKPSYYQFANGKDLNDIFEEGLLANPKDFYTGNIIKYVIRHEGKNGVEDLKKARTYLNRLIQLEEADNHG